MSSCFSQKLNHQPITQIKDLDQKEIKHLNNQISMIKNEVIDLKKQINNISPNHQTIDLSHIEKSIEDLQNLKGELIELKKLIDTLKDGDQKKDVELNELKNSIDILKDEDQKRDIELIEYNDKHIIDRLEEISRELDNKITLNDVYEMKQAQSPKERKDDFKIRNDINIINNKLLDLEERVNNNQSILMANLNAYSDEVINLKKMMNDEDKGLTQLEEKIMVIENKLLNSSIDDLSYFKKDLDRIKDLVFKNDSKESFDHLMNEVVSYGNKHNDLDKRIAILEELIKFKDRNISDSPSVVKRTIIPSTRAPAPILKKTPQAPNKILASITTTSKK